jgi:hypothetical protein
MLRIEDATSRMSKEKNERWRLGLFVYWACQTEVIHLVFGVEKRIHFPMCDWFFFPCPDPDREFA